MIQSILAFVIVFGIIVFIHESGHYLMAKRAGVLVREFAIGFGPKIFQTHHDETTYTLRVLPLGGYVMLAGSEEDEEMRLGMPVALTMNDDQLVTQIDLSQKIQHTDGLPIDVTDFDLVDDLYISGMIPGSSEEVRYELSRSAMIVREDGTAVQIAPRDRQLGSAPLGQRALINFAGPLANFILAIISFILFAFLQGGVYTTEPIFGEVLEGSAIVDSSFKSGDRVLEINDQSVDTWLDLTAIVQASPEEPLHIIAERPNGEKIEDTVVPNAVETPEGNIVGQLGVQVYYQTGFWDKIKYGFEQTWFYGTAIFRTLGQMLTGALGLEQLGGPIAIFSTTGKVAKVGGMIGIISFIGFLSVNLGIMNLLPIPGLDGGKLLLNAIEGIRGKPISQEKEMAITMIGAVLLIGLMIFVTWQDISRFIFN